MGRVLCAFLYLGVSSSIAFAQTLDQAKFLQAIELPAINTHLGVQFRAHERDGLGNKFDPDQKIADLQKKLTGRPEDAEILLEQRAVYLECVRDEKKANEMVQRAETMLRPHLQTNDSQKAFLLTTYGTTLETIQENPWNECEKLARRAVSLAPKDWRTWTYLAHVRHQRIPSILCGGDDSRLPREGRTQEVLGMLYLQRCRADDVNEAEKTLNEALQYHDRARELAPEDGKRQVQRYGFRLTEIVLRNAIAGFRGQKPPYPMQQVERVVLDELEAVARLHPDHLLWQSQLVFQMVILGWEQSASAEKKAEKSAIKAFRPAREQDALALREALARIEKIADSSRGEAAIYGQLLLAALYSSMQDYASVEKHARKVVAMDPKNQTGAEQLQQALLQQGRHGDQLKAAQALVQVSPTARNCYLLAKALGFNQRYDLAREAIKAGLKQDANDVHCLLGLAALMLRSAPNAGDLESVRDLLSRARRECRPEAGPRVLTEIEYLTAVYDALAGDIALSRLKLRHLQGENPDNPRYGKLLLAFGD